MFRSQKINGRLSLTLNIEKHNQQKGNFELLVLQVEQKDKQVKKSIQPNDETY